VTQRRRVLLCCEQYPPSVGGVQEVMRQIAERLAARGHDVWVATGSHPHRSTDTMVNGVRVVSFPISGNRVKGLSGPVAEYQKFLKEGAFDSILIKAAQQWTFDAAVDALPLVNAKKVFIPCGFSGLHDPRYRTYFGEMPQWLHLFDQLVFYASDYQDINFARQHGLTNLKLVPNGIDEREFSELNDRGIRTLLGIPPGNDLLLSVGSRIMAKGHWEVIEAFRLARLDRPTTLVLNGNPPQSGLLSTLKRAVKHAMRGRWPLTWEAALASRLSRKQVLVTDLPRAELLALFSAADLFLFASHVEYSPLVLFEAAASGTSFIASNVGNSREIANWTGGGHIIDQCTLGDQAPVTEVFARAMESALADRSKLRSEGLKARQKIFENGFTWAKIVETYADVLGLT